MASQKDNHLVAITNHYIDGSRRLSDFRELVDEELEKEHVHPTFRIGMKWIQDATLSHSLSSLAKEIEQSWTWPSREYFYDQMANHDVEVLNLKLMLLDCWHHIRLLNIEWNRAEPPEVEKRSPSPSSSAVPVEEAVNGDRQNSGGQYTPMSPVEESD